VIEFREERIEKLQEEICKRYNFKAGEHHLGIIIETMSQLKSEGGGIMVNRPLGELKPGEKGKVAKVSGKGSIHRRILDMGVVPGTKIEIERVAPLGDPIEVKIKDYHLSLRKEEAANISLEVEE